jgi:CheY-like chemotaxis protein
MLLSGDTLSCKGMILLVDDEEVVLDVGTQMLEKIGYSVFKAKNGKEAIAIFREHKAQVSLVILDLRMPEMDGECAYELLKEIKPDVKVLISSGCSLRDRTRQNLKYGYSGFIQKPFSLKGLSQKVEELIPG